MSEENKHINPHNDLSRNPLDVVSNAHIDWGRSKEDIWSELSKRIDISEPAKTRVLIAPWMKIAMAAVMALFIGLAVFMQLYTKTITVPAGTHSSLVLPDQSEVRLNAQSTVSYRPLKWRLSRKIIFEGEAFFEVKRGARFEVLSGNGKIQVLGTSFNVYSRDDQYEVTCVSGRVKVTENKANHEVVIHPGQKAALNPQGLLNVESDVNLNLVTSWLENKITFTAISLQEVFEEIGRQYGITIRFPEDINFTYTGTFRRDVKVEQALNMVCKPFNLVFSLQSKDEYIISRSNP